MAASRPLHNEMMNGTFSFFLPLRPTHPVVYCLGSGKESTDLIFYSSAYCLIGFWWWSGGNSPLAMGHVAWCDGAGSIQSIGKSLVDWTRTTGQATGCHPAALDIFTRNKTCILCWTLSISIVGPSFPLSLSSGLPCATKKISCCCSVCVYSATRSSWRDLEASSRATNGVLSPKQILTRYSLTNRRLDEQNEPILYKSIRPYLLAQLQSIL